MPISLGSQAQLGIGIAISLNNQFSGQANQINQQLMNMRKNAHSALTAVTRDYRNQAVAIAGIAAGVTAGFFTIAKEGAEFQHKINQTYIVGGQALGRNRRDLESFSRQMSRTFSRDPKEIAETMFEDVKAGVGKGLEEITKYQVAVATATDEALAGSEGVGEKLLGIANSMGISVTEQIDVAGKKMSQFARISNATTAAANATMASVYSIGESMEYFSNTAYHAGMSLEQALAMVGKLSQSKIMGSSAGTALNNMTQQLIMSVGPFMTKKKAKAWQMLGMNPKQVEFMINHGQIYEAMEMMDTHSRGMTRTNKLNAFNALFNMRGQRAMVNAFMGGDKSLGDIKREIESGIRGDVAMVQSKKMMNDLSGDLKFLSNAFFEFKIAFTKAIAPGLRIGMKAVIGIMHTVGKIVETPVGKFFAALVGIMAPMIAIMFAFRAAVLTATLALRTLSMGNSAGGFRGLVGGMLGSWGGMVAGGAGVAGVGVNKAGRFYVQGGQTLNYGGKLFKGGQVLPKAFSAGNMGGGFSIGNSIGSFLGMGSLAASNSATAGAVVGTLGKIGMWAGRIASFGMKWLPVVGWIWTAVELLRAIFGNSEDEKNDRKKHEDSAAMVYYRNLNDYMQNQEIARGSGYSRYFGKLNNMKWAAPGEGDMAPQPIMFNQNTNVNLDGQRIFSESTKKMLDWQAASQSDFNFTY